MDTYPLAELTHRAGLALDALGVQVGNRRVRQRPDARTVRYYTQHGLVDRPLPVGGREARYGRRHLVQVVAVKRLQAAGVSLADIQRRLAGAADDELLAAIGTGAEAALAAAAGPAATPAGAPSSAVRAAAFWRAAPAELADPVSCGPSDGVRTAVVVSLAPGVQLTVDVTAGSGAASVDAGALREAARPLLDLLSQLGIQADEGTSA